MSYSWGAGRDAAASGRPHGTRPALTVHSGGRDPGRTPPRDLVRDVAREARRTPAPQQERLADELAPMVDVWQRLLLQHVPDAAGRCRCCTKGGTGLPSTPWPCSIYGLADLARRSHGAR